MAGIVEGFLWDLYRDGRIQVIEHEAANEAGLIVVGTPLTGDIEEDQGRVARLVNFTVDGEE